MHSLAIHRAPNLQSGSLALFLLLRFVHHFHYMPHIERETVTEVVLSRSSFFSSIMICKINHHLPVTLNLVIMNIFLYQLLYDRIVTCVIVSVTRHHSEFDPTTKSVRGLIFHVQFGLIRTLRLLGR
jgi:hypothetical protein